MGAFRRVGAIDYSLHLKFVNNSGQDLSDFLMKMNNNYYGIQVKQNFSSAFYVASGATVET